MDERWVGIRSLTNPEVVSELEREHGIYAVKGFENFIKFYNGGHITPHPYIYNPEIYKGAIFSQVLSFNEEDKDNVFSVINSIIETDDKLPFIPFGRSKSGIFGINGKYIYVRDETTNDTILLLDNFNMFISYLT